MSVVEGPPCKMLREGLITPGGVAAFAIVPLRCVGSISGSLCPTCLCHGKGIQGGSLQVKEVLIWSAAAPHACTHKAWRQECLQLGVH